jgi:hypothetical protein|tara:strand:- start:2053 stop:2325 length:273 start_codon:yes stop_codon:yes gene_type:complete
MKNRLLIIFALLMSNAGYACEVCKAKQPKGFENLTHGEGPQGNIDYFIMYSAILIVGYTLIMSVKYLINPKEKNQRHIKNIVLNESNFPE